MDRLTDRLIVIKNNLHTVLEYDYSIEGLGDVSIRSKAEEKAYAHGAVLVGDGFYDSKKIKIGIETKAETQRDHLDAVNKIIRVFAGRDYKLVNGITDSFYNIAGLGSIKHKFQKGYKNRWSDIELTLILTDPFRYLVRPIVVEQELTTPNQDGYHYITVPNIGSEDSPLIITLTPRTSMQDVEIIHLDTNRKGRLRDSLLTAPKSVVIDSRSGTVYRGEVENAINGYSGLFLNAISGINTYKVKAAQGSIKIQLYARWII